MGRAGTLQKSARPHTLHSIVPAIPLLQPEGPQPPKPGTVGQKKAAPPPAQKADGGNGKVGGMAALDPESFERAAAAIREMNSSPHASKVRWA